MAGRRRPHTTTRRPGRRQLPISLWWQRIRRRWQTSMHDACQGLQNLQFWT